MADFISISHTGSMPQVGKNKLKMIRGENTLPDFRFDRELSEGEFGHIPRTTARAPLPPPPFNVLYVEPIIPPILRAPLVTDFIETVKETIELLRPLTRLGLPEAPFWSKMPYHG